MPKDKALYQSSQIRQYERKAIDEIGLSEDELMTRAGMAAFEALRSYYNQVTSIAVFCGSGNNGGDGYVLARLLHEQGMRVVVYQNKPKEHLPPAAKKAALDTIASGVSLKSFDEAIDSDIELIVDALLGIGIKGKVHGAIKHCIERINESGLPVVSIDIPSGLNADTGESLGNCIVAAITVTFIALKAGMYTLDGPDHCGDIVCHDLQLPINDPAIPPVAELLDFQTLSHVLKPRLKNSHKGTYGHVLVVGSGPGMPGACCLSAMAALRVGAGMVTIATHPNHAGKVIPGLPEVMIYGVRSFDELLPLVSRATVCVLGPGLGEDAWAMSLFKGVMSAELPRVLDASALRLLTRHQQKNDNWILTPHPGEAAQLLGKSTSAVQTNRLQAARDIQKRYGGSVVLKGVGTLIDNGEHPVSVCSAGNPGMASAGMGDVLSGVIGGLLAQGLAPEHAALSGVWLHATAADDAAIKHGERGMIASDLMPFLRRLVNDAKR